MRPSRSAPVGVVTELVDVEPALGVGVVALDLVLDDGRSGLGFLRELDDAGDAGVAAEGCNCEGLAGGGAEEASRVLAGNYLEQRVLGMRHWGWGYKMGAAPGELHLDRSSVQPGICAWGFGHNLEQ